MFLFHSRFKQLCTYIARFFFWISDISQQQSSFGKERSLDGFKWSYSLLMLFFYTFQRCSWTVSCATFTHIYWISINEKERSHSFTGYQRLGPPAGYGWCPNLQHRWWTGCTRGSTCRRPCPARCCCRCSGARRSWPASRSTRSRTSCFFFFYRCGGKNQKGLAITAANLPDPSVANSWNHTHHPRRRRRPRERLLHSHSRREKASGTEHILLSGALEGLLHMWFQKRTCSGRKDYFSVIGGHFTWGGEYCWRWWSAWPCPGAGSSGFACIRGSTCRTSWPAPGGRWCYPKPFSVGGKENTKMLELHVQFRRDSI